MRAVERSRAAGTRSRTSCARWTASWGDIAGFALREDEARPRHSRGAAGAFDERGFGTSASIGGLAEREVGLRLVQAEFGGVEPEPAAITRWSAEQPHP